jgi:hypothetical protein
MINNILYLRIDLLMKNFVNKFANNKNNHVYLHPVKKNVNNL